MSANWFCEIGGKRAGPFTRQELCHLARQGRIVKSTLVREGAEGVFTSAESVGFLFPHDLGRSQAGVVKPDHLTPPQIAPAPFLPPPAPAIPPLRTRSGPPARSKKRFAVLAWFSGNTAITTTFAVGAVVLGLFAFMLGTRLRRAPADSASNSPVADVRTVPTPRETPSSPQPSPRPDLAHNQPQDQPPERLGSPVVAPLPRSKEKEREIDDIVADCEPSVAIVRGTTSSGTAFLAAPGVLVTNAHVISMEFIDSLEIFFPSAPSAEQGPVSAQLLFQDRDRDLAILRVNSKLKPLRLAETFDYRKGQKIVVIGSPGVGDQVVIENTPSQGILGVRMTIDGHDFFQLSVAINPGNSGGPVIDMKEEVIAVATLKASKQEGLAFGIPYKDVRAALAASTGQQPDSRAQVETDHRVRVASARLTTVSEVYLLAIQEIARAKRMVGGVGFAELVKKTREKLIQVTDPLETGLDVNVAEVARDNRLPLRIRQDVAALRELLLELKGQIGRSTGTFESLQRKHDELAERQNKLVNSLESAMGTYGGK